MKITYDTLADIVYMKISDQPISDTVRAETNIIIDRDSAGKVVGLELLNASREKSFIEHLHEHAAYGIPVEITSATPTHSA